METKIRDFVTKRYIAEGKDSTAKEIAAGLGVSEAAVRKTLNDNRFDMDGYVARYQESRSNTSRNYGFAQGTHKVWMYGPSRGYLAKLMRREQMNDACPRDVDGHIPGYC